MRTVSQLTFSEYRFRMFWSVQSAIEKSSHESVVVLKVFVHSELICIFFFFIHSNALTKSFFEVKFSWSVGDTWPKMKVRFPRDLYLLVCVFFQSFRPDYRQKNALWRISFHLLARYVNFYLYFLEEIVLNLVYFLIQLFSNTRCGQFPSNIY